MKTFSKTPDQPKPAAEKHDKSFEGSLDRLAKVFREKAASLGHPSLAAAADALEGEADLLDPSRVTKREKEIADRKAAIAKAEDDLKKAKS